MLEAEAVSRVHRALELRRAATVAAEIPGLWLLDSPGVAGAIEIAKRLARAPGAPVLIEGERGTGVVELGRVIHDADPIAGAGRMRVIGAHLVSPSDMRGWALTGTLFIEDLENLRPVGQTWIAELLAGRLESSLPVRIVAGSRLSVRDLLRHGGLNQELIHALDVGRLVIPPLRSRPMDILRLARTFLAHYADWQGRPHLRLSEAAERKLLAHSYPANVRELRNVVERAVALASLDEVGDDAIVFFERSEVGVRSHNLLRAMAAGDDGISKVPTLADLERDYLVMLIREFKGRRAAMSRAMGVSYPTVLKKIARHGLDVRSIVEAAAPLTIDVAG